MMEGKQFLDANMRTRFTDKYVQCEKKYKEKILKSNTITIFQIWNFIYAYCQ